MESVRVNEEWTIAFVDRWNATVDNYFETTTDPKLHGHARQHAVRNKLEVILNGLLKEFTTLEGPIARPSPPKAKRSLRSSAPPTAELLAKVKTLRKSVQKKEAYQEKLLAKIKKLEESIPKEIEGSIKQKMQDAVVAAQLEDEEDGSKSNAPQLLTEEDLLDVHNGYMSLFADVSELRAELASHKGKVQRYRGAVEQFGDTLPDVDVLEADVAGPERTRTQLASRFRSKPY
mmetsp:Transcript_831/g.3031  ORF Transcript_831/g.3031 Transcript_831/m.3031 type:complete len:232 (+) Transcript_831:35-730(+)